MVYWLIVDDTGHRRCRCRNFPVHVDTGLCDKYYFEILFYNESNREIVAYLMSIYGLYE